VGLTGYREVLRFRELLARAESAERMLSRSGSREARALEEALAATGRLDRDDGPAGEGALLLGGVDYERAEGEPSAGPAAPEREPGRGPFLPLPGIGVEVEDLRRRLGKKSATLLLGAQAIGARVRSDARGRRLLHFATHAFSRDDLLRGLRRDLGGGWTSAEEERQLAAGHDPMLLSGLLLAGACSGEGANGDDGILTALEASYLDLDSKARFAPTRFWAAFVCHGAEYR